MRIPTLCFKSKCYFLITENTQNSETDRGCELINKNKLEWLLHTQVKQDIEGKKRVKGQWS